MLFWKAGGCHLSSATRSSIVFFSPQQSFSFKLTWSYWLALNPLLCLVLPLTLFMVFFFNATCCQKLFPSFFAPCQPQPHTANKGHQHNSEASVTKVSMVTAFLADCCLLKLWSLRMAAAISLLIDKAKKGGMRSKEKFISSRASKEEFITWPHSPSKSPSGFPDAPLINKSHISSPVES